MPPARGFFVGLFPAERRADYIVDLVLFDYAACALGTGALLAGLMGLLVAGPGRITDGNVAAILVTALLILPASFFSLSQASRYTQAANVSLLMLLETVLGPLWVWIALGEAPTARMLTGGAIVLASLALYILLPQRRRGAPEAA